MKKLMAYIVCAALLLCSTVLASPEQVQQIETVSETVLVQTPYTAVLTANFDEGNGTEASPYIISTSAQLLSVANIVKNSTEALYFKLASDIDLEGTEWTPIGTLNVPFNGAFDGAGYTVRNLKITTPQEYSGFFGVVEEADISRLSIENMTIDFEHSSLSKIYAGLLFASALKKDTNAELTNTFSEICVSGNINITRKSGAVTAGGIAGRMEVKTGNYIIKNCISLANINVVSENRNAYVGGIVGAMTDNSSYEMSVEKSYYYGYCSAKADNKNVYVGGIAGYIWSNGPYSGWYSDDATLYSSDIEYSIKNCFAGGSVYASGSESNTNIGRIHGAENQSATIKNCAYIETQTISAAEAGEPYTNYTGIPSKITADKVVSSDYLSNTLGFNLIDIWEIDNDGICKYPYLKSCGIPNISGDIYQDLQINDYDLEVLAKHIAGTCIITDEKAIKRADVYTDSNANLASNLDIKDLILLAQYISGKNVTLR